ncbi:MAG: stage II sporulation protein R [Firmicutes bacterium]|nr:stage II sporulation protein R [Bacillota bacterium]
MEKSGQDRWEQERKLRRKLRRKQILTGCMALLMIASMAVYMSKAEANRSVVKKHMTVSERWSTTPSAGEEQTNLGESVSGGEIVAGLMQSNADHEGIIRLHVIANSDSEEDQALKLKVRNLVLLRVQFQLEQFKGGGGVGKSDSDHIRTYIQDNLELIENWAREAIEAEGYDYPVKASLGMTWIPAKKYDDLYFPAGNYEALNIVIGEGAGQNWWCVLFPPLCLIDGNDPAALGDSNGSIRDGITATNGNRIILKSKIKELLKGSGKKAKK